MKQHNKIHIIKYINIIYIECLIDLTYLHVELCLYAFVLAIFFPHIAQIPTEQEMHIKSESIHQRVHLHLMM